MILAEDEQTLEGVVLVALVAQRATPALVETFTAWGSPRSWRISPGRMARVRRGVIARDLDLVPGAVGLVDVRLERRDDAGEGAWQRWWLAARDGAACMRWRC